MAKIPYQPFSTERPIPGTGSRGFSVRTNEEMFGGGIASAISQLGKTVEGAGQEVFNRAIAMKELDNRNDATMAAADFSDEASKQHQRLKSLEGAQAVKANETFNDEIEASRQSIRSRLTSPSAQRYYDSETRGIANRARWSAAEWAGGQQRKYTDQADKADVLMEQKSAGVNPKDDTIFQGHLDRIAAKITSQMQGDVDELGIPKWSESETKYRIFEAQSTAYRNRLVELSKIDPFSASHKFNSVSDKLTQDDRMQTRNILDTNRRILGSRLTVSDVMAGRNTNLGARPVSIEKAQYAIGGFESGNNYKNVGVETKYGKALGRYQVMEKFLPDFLKEAGMKPMTRDEFLNSPAAQDELFQKVFSGYMQKHGSFNEAASRWFTGKSIAAARADGVFDAHGTTVDKYIANSNAWLSRVASERDIMAVAEAKGNEVVNPEDDPIFITDYLRPEVRKQYTLVHQLQREKEIENLNTMAGALSASGPDGKYPTSPDELFTNPQVKAAYDELTEKQKAAVSEHLIANIKKGYALTPDKQARFNQLRGMMTTSEGREELIGIDLLAEKLPNNMYQAVLADQNKLRTKFEEDPRISAVMNDGMAQQKMRDLGLMRDQNKNAHDEFAGILQNMLNTAQGVKGAALSRKEAKEVFDDAVEQEVTKGWLWGYNREEPFFNLPPKTDAEKKLWDDLMKNPKFSTESNAVQQAIFVEIKYRALLEKRKAAKQPTTTRAGP